MPGLLAEVSTKFQKMHFFRQFKNHNSGREHRNQTNDPIFSSTFSDLFVIFISEFEYSKFIFMWSPLWSILVCKIPQFLAKSYRFRQLITLFQKVDTLRLLKIHIMFCSPAGAKYPIFQAVAHGLCVECLYSKFFWYVFSRIWTEYKEILRISPYSVRRRENTDQKKSKYRHFSRSVIYFYQ